MRWRWQKRNLGDRRPEAPTRDHDDLGIRFGQFLRFHPDVWRDRRTDSLIPLDVNVALRTIRVQGTITFETVKAFASDPGGFSHPGDADVLMHGSLLTYLPIVLRRKELLLGFNVFDAGHRNLPVVARFDDSQIVGRGLLRLLSPNASDAQEAPLLAVLTALAFVNPRDVADRLRTWADTKGIRFGPSLPLTPDDHLLDWVEEQAEFLVPKLGDRARGIVAQALAQHRDWCAEHSALSFRPSDSSDVTPFRTLPLLLFHAIGDVLGTAPAALTPNANADMRSEDFANWLASTFVVGLERLQEVAQNDTERGYFTQLVGDIASWTPFVPLELKVGDPFVVTLEEALYFDRNYRWRHLRWLQDIGFAVFGLHFIYELDLFDAPSFHLEVQINTPEIRLANGDGPARYNAWGLMPRRQVGIVGTKRSPDTETVVGRTSQLFDAERRASDRMMHFYSSTRSGEAPLLTEFKWELHVPIRLSTVIRGGYVLTAVALVAACGSDGEHGRQQLRLLPIPRQGGVSDYRASALAVTVSLWLSQVQYAQPIVAHKLRLARLSLQASVAVILATMLTLAGFVIFRYHGHLEHPPSQVVVVTNKKGVSSVKTKPPTRATKRPGHRHDH